MSPPRDAAGAAAIACTVLLCAGLVFAQPLAATTPSTGMAEALTETLSTPLAEVAGQWASPDTTAEERKPGVAIFPFQNGGSYGEDKEDLQALEVGLQQMLLTELDQNDELRIIERGMLKEIMEEQDLRTSGRVDPSTAAEIGKLVGARYMVTGVFADLYGTFRMDARIVDVESGEILQTESVRGEKEKLYTMLVDLATRITEGADLPLLPVAAREERKERDIPSEAVTLYSRAQVYKDRGLNERAVQMYEQIVDRFPDLVEARQELEQLTG